MRCHVTPCLATFFAFALTYLSADSGPQQETHDAIMHHHHHQPMDPDFLTSALSSSHVIPANMGNSMRKGDQKSESTLVPAVETAHVVAPVDLQICNLSVEVTGKSLSLNISSALKRRTIQAQVRTPKPLLCSVSAKLEPGSLTAILGTSGSGKSTLLDALAGRLAGGRRISGGSIICNGGDKQPDVRQAYVTQEDVLLPTLTVRETLDYTADLRLPQSMTAPQRRKVVDNIISELGLEQCADTRIGDRWRRGCSGGEKRRVSIGVQLLENPSLLYLDEPTTGLDAASALVLTSTIRRLCQRNRVVVMTVHQPRPEIWSLFDNLIILAEGSALYSGPACDALPWFEMQGFKIPMFVNPPDFLVDISAIDYRTAELEAESKSRVGSLRHAWHSQSQCQGGFSASVHQFRANQDGGSKALLQCTSLARQVRVLTHRTMKVTYRDPLGLTACTIEAILMGLVVGYMFFDLDGDQAGIKSREGCLYVAASLQGYLMLIFETYRMTLDIPIFDREASDGYVQPVAFILSRRLAKGVSEDLPVPIILSSFIYFMTGLDRQASKVLTFFAISILNHYLAVLCATGCVVLRRDFPTASLIASLVYTLQSLASGLIVHVDTMPVYVGWTRWITYMFYTFSAFIVNEFENNSYDCPFPGGSQNPDCVQYQGNFVIESLGFPLKWTGRAIACMVGFILTFLIFSVAGLHILKPVASQRVRSPRPRPDLLDRVGEATGSIPGELHSTTVTLHEYSLTLRKRTLEIFKIPSEHKTVISPISTTFEPGVLNIILGPSGCGKTSLLDSIGQRLRPTMRVNHISSGKIWFNGIELSVQDLRSRCAYATQGGELLLPALTVRETLYHAAALRLQGYSGDAKVARRVEGLLCTLGLKGCADTLVGSDSFRGISGGEKKRLALAIQILNDPQVLLVDEPTSGLDAFTANSIMKLLHDIAKDGRTVIVTIHQPRSDLFNYFGNILLLAEGGCTTYSGPAKDMIRYLAETGHECPIQTNPADFALDLITVSGKIPAEVEESQRRMKRLIRLWREHEAGRSHQGGQSSLPSHMSSSPLYPKTKAKSAYFCTAQLLQRAARNMFRQPQLVFARVMQSSGVAIIFTLFFAPLGHDYSSIQNRFGLFQQLGGFYIIGMLTNAAVYPFERDVAYGEIQDGVYTVDAFLASYTILELPFEIVNSLFLGLLLTFAVGLPHTVPSYFVASLAGFSGLSCGESLGIMFNALFSHTGFAMNLMGVLLAVANAMAGILSLDIPPLLQGFNYLSPIRYQVRGVAYYSLVDQTFDCDLDYGCPIRTGNEALELYGFDGNPMFSVLGMVLCIVGYRLAAWVVLRVLRQVRSS